MKFDLRKREAGGAKLVASADDVYQFKLPPMPPGEYGLAQVDNYMHLRREKFPHRAPVSLQLEARLSAPDPPGTWGFGFWNDPFSAGFGLGGMRRFLPVLPNAAWFFYGSEHNHLTLRDDLPGKGLHAKVFRSPLLPSILSLLALPALPFFIWPFTARGLRRIARLFVKEDAVSLEMDVTHWHRYTLRWEAQHVEFKVDGSSILNTRLIPNGRLGLVLWIDNQTFKFTPDGKIGLGFLATSSPQVMMVRNLTLKQHNGYD
jgi:hypothetical protein